MAFSCALSSLRLTGGTTVSKEQRDAQTGTGREVVRRTRKQKSTFVFGWLSACLWSGSRLWPLAPHCVPPKRGSWLSLGPSLFFFRVSSFFARLLVGWFVVGWLALFYRRRTAFALLSLLSDVRLLSISSPFLSFLFPFSFSISLSAALGLLLHQRLHTYLSTTRLGLATQCIPRCTSAIPLFPNTYEQKNVIEPLSPPTYSAPWQPK
ncbi:hypothetical protein BKA81DRAFT_111304 [Phyllosticta paracitricarpa]|uniref:Transmembrane protein n=2 Tax=Phyllosticta TaxID=121621 RepID=A0ABR1LKU9_9PEZI